ncbi:MAG: sigma factor [Verrucomicrobiota bacterium]
MEFHESNSIVPNGQAAFNTTRWSIVHAAGDRQSPDAAAALEVLCRAYWYPLYVYIRRKGLSPSDAQDVTQEFFYRLIGKNSLESVDSGKGSFRSFLLASVNHLLANEWDKARALKRGGDRHIVSLEAEEAEGRFAQESSDHDSPEKAFDRRWALTLLERALVLLREESAATGKLPQFDRLKVFLSDLPGPGDYAALAGPLEMQPGAVAVAVHRLRLRYREIVRAEVAQTVATESELNFEMHHLFAALER